MQSDEELRDIIIKLASKSESTVTYRILIDDSGTCRIPDVALTMLDEDEPDVVNAALIVLRNYSRGRGKEYLEKAIHLLDQLSYSENVMTLIRWYGGAAYVPRVMKFLSYPMPELRIAAIRTFECFNFAKPELHEIALAMINDPDENVRLTLVLILSRSKDPKIINKLIEMMLSDPDENVRATLAVIHRSSKDPKMVSKWISLMYNDVSYEVRKTAAYSLKYHNDPKAKQLGESWIANNEKKQS
jgi:HEAT repeat protein